MVNSYLYFNFNILDFNDDMFKCCNVFQIIYKITCQETFNNEKKRFLAIPFLQFFEVLCGGRIEW